MAPYCKGNNGKKPASSPDFVGYIKAGQQSEGRKEKVNFEAMKQSQPHTLASASRRGPLDLFFVLLLLACFGCASNQRAQEAPRSQDLLELLTGFGESLSKRNFALAADYLVPEDKAMLVDERGRVPEDKQRAMQALPLQRLLNHPRVRVEEGRIAGIYALLPNLSQGKAVALGAEGDSAASPEYQALFGERGSASAEGGMPAEMPAGEAPFSSDPTAYDRQLAEEFFAAVTRRKWAEALGYVHETERQRLVDEKGRVTEKTKRRLARLQQDDLRALLLVDGKLTGVTLVLPDDAAAQP